MAYKIGSVIRILKEKEMREDKESIFPYFVEEMNDYYDKIGVIADISYNEEYNTIVYQIKFGFEDFRDNYWDFAEWMFDKSIKDEMEKINLSDFNTLESLLDYVEDKYGEYFDKKVARKKFLELQPTEEEIEVLQMLNSLGGILFYDHHDSFVLINDKAFKMKMFERFEEIMDYLNFTDNVFLPINLLLGESEKKEND